MQLGRVLSSTFGSTFEVKRELKCGSPMLLLWPTFGPTFEANVGTNVAHLTHQSGVLFHAQRWPTFDLTFEANVGANVGSPPGHPSSNIWSLKMPFTHPSISCQIWIAIYRWKVMDTSIMTQLKFLAKYKRFKSSFENRFFLHKKRESYFRSHF